MCRLIGRTPNQPQTEATKSRLTPKEAGLRPDSEELCGGKA